MVLDMLLLLNLQSKQVFFGYCCRCLKEILTPHRLGLKIAIADCDEKNLTQVGHELTTIIGQSNVLVIPTDVSKLDQVVKLRDRVYETWGEVRNHVCLCLFLFVRWQIFASVGTQQSFYSRVSLPDLFLGSCSNGHVRFGISCHSLYILHTPTLIPIQPVMFANLHIGRCAHEQCWDRQ